MREARVGARRNYGKANMAEAGWQACESMEESRNNTQVVLASLVDEGTPRKRGKLGSHVPSRVFKLARIGPLRGARQTFRLQRIRSSRFVIQRAGSILAVYSVPGVYSEVGEYQASSRQAGGNNWP